MQSETLRSLRIGQGYDLHRLAETSTSSLLLGGLQLHCGYRSIAHSDGDALCHAVIDSLLGALALGDIGSHFPPNDAQWHNANSLEMLQTVYRDQILAKGYQLLNLDCTVILEKVRLRLLIDDIRHSLLRGFTNSPESTTPRSGNPPITVEQISVKAKTKEKIGAVGRGEALEVFATCLLYQ